MSLATFPYAGSTNSEVPMKLTLNQNPKHVSTTRLFVIQDILWTFYRFMFKCWLYLFSLASPVLLWHFINVTPPFDGDSVAVSSLVK